MRMTRAMMLWTSVENDADVLLACWYSERLHCFVVLRKRRRALQRDALQVWPDSDQGFPTASTYPGHGPLGGADEAATSATSSETCAMDCTPDTREEEAMLSRLGPQPRKRHWLGLESRQDSGPARESGTDVSVPRRDDPQDTAYTGSKAAEQRILLHMAPRRKPRRRPPPSSRYDQLVLLAEQSAQRRHDALYGPSLGAGLDRTLEAVQQTPVVDSRLDLQAMD
ncbi:hypothetical protein AK812_SmicGene30226 [Symbiodinium microadriaticum]|uniref:Uncharacterized protein n=1 Tax=Symbiodinium microadriaticum TaxID=2951 RepID=A0A1Q9CZW4_SYMMI|nr:hypothetical protein AK812_SmicGene30226 [Symbiodinium microadriaticum]